MNPNKWIFFKYWQLTLYSNRMTSFLNQTNRKYLYRGKTMKDLKLWLIQTLNTITVLLLHQVICILTEKLHRKLHLSRKATEEKLNYVLT